MDSRPGARPEAIGSETRRYARILHRQRWWVLGTAAVTFLLTLAFTALQEPASVTTAPSVEVEDAEEVIARVLVTDPDQIEAQAGVEAISMATHAQLITSIDLLEEVSRDIRPALTAEDLVGNLTVTVQPDSRILLVGYRSSGEEGAEEVVRAVVNSYLADLERRDRRDLQRHLAELQARVKTLSGRLESGTPGVTTQFGILSVQEQILLVQSAIARLDRGEIVGVGPAPVAVATPSPTTPIAIAAPEPSLKRNGAAGLVLGVLLGLAVAMAREALDPRLTNKRRLETELGLPVLFLHPEIPDNSDPSFGRVLPLLEKRLGDGATLCVTGFAAEQIIADAARALADHGSSAGTDVVLVEQSEVGQLGDAHRMRITPTPAYLSSPSAAQLAAKGADLLFVIDGSSAKTEEVREALEELRHSGVSPIGAFLYQADES